MPLLEVKLKDSCVWSGPYCLVKQVPSSVTQVTKASVSPAVLVMGWDQSTAADETTLVGQVQLEAMVYSQLHTSTDGDDPDGLATAAQVLLCDLTGHGPYAVFVPLSKKPYHSTTNLVRCDSNDESGDCLHLHHARSPEDSSSSGIIPSLIVAVGSDPFELMHHAVAASSTVGPEFAVPSKIINGLSACIQYHCSAGDLPSRRHPFGMQLSSVSSVDVARTIRDCCTNISVQVYRHSPRRSILQSPTLRERDGMGPDVMVGIRASDRYLTYHPDSSSFETATISSSSSNGNGYGNGNHHHGNGSANAIPAKAPMPHCMVAPIVDIIGPGGSDSTAASYVTETGVKVYALASFGVIGLLGQSCCPAAAVCAYRIMPAAAVRTPETAGAPITDSHVGVVAELEVRGTGCLLVLCRAAKGIFDVLVNGSPAEWQYDKDTGAMRIDLPGRECDEEFMDNKSSAISIVDIIV